MIQRKAVFLDRDGVLIEDVNLLTRRDQVLICNKTPVALNALNASEYAIFVITNQPVVARGLATEQDVEELNSFIGKKVFEKSGCKIERFYYCPHHPEATLPEYRIKCDCRKPRPGMLLQAAREYNLDLSASFMIGDRISDIIAGYRAGCTTILVKTGMHKAKPIVSDAMDLTVKPDHVCNDLYEASGIILREYK
ncbi:MAG: HAD-IIIA family hydrolase [Planctomycetaceae bacterium]|nr:MAG: HAD-IIIA family hydrolase [Planctomycetaceae bacterium]